MEFTGERFIPGKGGAQISYEHLHRYLFATKFSENKKVLDLGCGEGYGSDMLSKKAISVVGLDISKEAIENARLKYRRENLKFTIGECDAIPFKSNSFDLVVNFEVIEHIRNQGLMLEEIRRVLSEKGILIISSPSRKNTADNKRILNKFHVKELSREEFVNLLKEYFADISMLGQDPVAGSMIWQEEKERRESNVEFFQVNLKEPEKVDLQQGISQDSINPIYHIALCSKNRLSEINNKTCFSFLNDEAKLFLEEKDEMIKKIEELSKVIENRNAEILKLQQFADKVKRTVAYRIYNKTRSLVSLLISLTSLLLKAILFIVLLPFVILFWILLVIGIIIFS